MIATIDIPEIYRQKDSYKYPPNNDLIFEDYFLSTYQPSLIGDDREYLAIAWSSYYRRAMYGKDTAMMRDLQKFINSLDRSKKYFTVITWDEGILQHLGDLDIKIFAASGPRIDYPIPLLCQPHPYHFRNQVKDIDFSFVGGITHPIRDKMIRAFQNKPKTYISTRPHNPYQYCSILARSKYVLCPRGYGQTSFRICEAMQYDAIPIYFSDQFVIPYNELPMQKTFQNFNGIDGLKLDWYTKFSFTYEYCRNKILQNI